MHLTYDNLFHIKPYIYLVIMCELNVNMVEGTNTITLMEDVVRLVVNNNEITITGMLGETLTVQGKIMHVDLTKQEALIRKID